MSAGTLPAGLGWRYGLLGLPLAFAALPVYVHVPHLYASELGLSLSLVGGILLATRVADAFADPLLGWLSDRRASRRRLLALALPPLGLGLAGLLLPPAGAGALWLTAGLVLVSAGYSLATINHAAWGAELGRDDEGRTRLVASREGFALIGVMLASALPGLLADSLPEGLARMAVVFIVLLGLAALASLPGLPAGLRPSPVAEGPWAGLRLALSGRGFAALLAVFAVNGVAAAIPASTVLFFVADVVQREDLSGLFLALYFVAGAAGLPLWVRLARRIGKPLAWLAGMGLAMLVFAWAGSLGAGDARAFGLICVLSGLALGADLALPSAILADQLAHGRSPRAGACFGCWACVAKASLALAAGLALPMLDALGYAPGQREPAALGALAMVYGGLPLVLKMVAAGMLWRWRRILDGRDA